MNELAAFSAFTSCDSRFQSLSPSTRSAIIRRSVNARPLPQGPLGEGCMPGLHNPAHLKKGKERDMPSSPQKRRAIVDSENALRDSLWPDAGVRLWGHKASGGFVTTPKTMPYICRILDEMSKDHPLGPTYEALWSYTWGNNAFLRFNKPDDVAYAAGFSGQRGRRTLIDRMRRLQLLGFIEAEPNGNEPLGFLFLPNPHAVLFAHHNGTGPKLPSLPPKGLTTHITSASWNAFISRALDLGCKDVKALMAGPPAAPAAHKKKPIKHAKPVKAAS